MVDREIRRKMDIACGLPYTGLVYDRFFFRIRLYFSLYDTEINDRNTDTGKTTKKGDIRSCLFGLENIYHVIHFSEQHTCPY